MNQKKRNKGIYYTPPEIATYLTRKSMIYFLRKNKDINSLNQLIDSYKDSLDSLMLKIQNLQILDPACGDGIFIKTALEEISELIFNIKHINKKGAQNSVTHIGLSKKDLIKNIISNNLHGIDSNKNAIESVRSELIKKCKDENEENFKSALNNSFIIGNTLINDKSYIKNGIEWKKAFKSVMSQGGFDIILGNPPWGANLKDLKNYLRDSYPKIAKGQFDTFAIFIYVALKELLRENGVLGFVVPNELLLLEQFKSLRKFLLNYQIFELINLGYGIFEEDIQKPALLLIVRKESSNGNYKEGGNKVLASVNITKKEKHDFLNRGRNFETIINYHSYYRSQNDFVKNRDNIFDIFSNKIDRRIKLKIESNEFKPLKTYFINGRGIDTNKRGHHFICPSCGCLNPPFGRGHSGRKLKKKCVNPLCNYIFRKRKEEVYQTQNLILEKVYRKGPHNAPGYIGEDLHRFRFGRKPRLIKYYGNCKKDAKFFKYSFIAWKDPKLYEGEKLLIRKVSSGHLPQVMVANTFLIGNQQIYFFKKRDTFNQISIYFYLAILTSRLIHFYYLKEFGDPDKNVMPHFTQSNLKRLPIPEPTPNETRYKELIDKTKKILCLAKLYHREKRERKSIYNKIEPLFNQLENIIFQYYNIHEPDFKKRVIDVANRNGFKIL